jgi:hypothetical protein
MSGRTWLITDKGDPQARSVVDHGRGDEEPHYSRQTPGASQWTRNGENLVFITADNLVVWCTHRPSPGKSTRQDGLDAWECTLFRNCAPPGRYLSSDLIREATALTYAIWAGTYADALPADGLITFIKPEATARRRSKRASPGACYLHAGWEAWGNAKDGKPRLRAPRPQIPEAIPDWREWSFKPRHGGIVRERLEAIDGTGQRDLFPALAGAA